MQSYMFLVPFIGWLVAIITKFLVNYLYHSKSNIKLAFSNGGFPSVHTTIMITTTAYIGFLEGINSTIFMLAICLSFIIMIDATHLRRSLGKHAKILNQLTDSNLHEKEGHSYFEIAGGTIIGIFTGYVLYYLN